MLAPQILAIDIGAGTQDILIYQPGREEENNPQLILPSPSRVWAERLGEETADLFISGDTIGGGRIGPVLECHIKEGRRIFMTEEAAYTIRDDLNEVRERGVEVVGQKPADFAGDEVTLKEVDIPFLRQILNPLGEGNSISLVAIAVQDHGSSPSGGSDRKFRFSCFQQTLAHAIKGFEGFIYLPDEIPSYYRRMSSAARRAKRETDAQVLLMDTVFSAILGAVREVNGPSLVVNVGNGHTVMAIVVDGEIRGILEHHTSLLTPTILRDYLIRFSRGEVSSEEVYREGGHGALVLDSSLPPLSIIVTGPKREIMKETGLPYHFPAPGGNMMMTGPWGLVEAARIRGLIS